MYQKVKIFVQITVAAMGAVILLGSSVVFAQKTRLDAESLVLQAAQSVVSFSSTAELKDFQNQLNRARAILVIPRSIEAGFILSLNGGVGVMMRRNDAGGWNGPAFYDAGGGGIGLQAGAKVSEIMLLVMSDRATTSMMDADIKLGAGISVAVGVGGGIGSDITADVIVYSKSAGLFGGIALEGGSIEIRPDLNSAYYGHSVSTRDILLHGKAGFDRAAPLREAINNAKIRGKQTG